MPHQNENIDVKIHINKQFDSTINLHVTEDVSKLIKINKSSFNINKLKHAIVDIFRNQSHFTSLFTNEIQYECSIYSYSPNVAEIEIEDDDDLATEIAEFCPSDADDSQTQHFSSSKCLNLRVVFFKRNNTDIHQDEIEFYSDIDENVEDMEHKYEAADDLMYVSNRWMLKTPDDYEYFCITNHCWNKHCDQIAITYRNKHDIYIYDISHSTSNYEVKHQLCCHKNNILSIDWDYTRNRIVSLCEDALIIIWNFNTENNKWDHPQHILNICAVKKRNPKCVKWSPNGNKIAIGAYETVYVAFYHEQLDGWIAKTKRPFRAIYCGIRIFNSSVLCVDWSCNNTSIIIGGTDFRCRIFNKSFKRAGDRHMLSDVYKSNLFEQSKILIVGYIRIIIDKYIPMGIIGIIISFYPFELQHKMSLIFHGTTKNQIYGYDIWNNPDYYSRGVRSTCIHIQSCVFSPSGLGFAYVASNSTITFGLFVLHEKKVTIQEIRLRCLPFTCVKFLNDRICIGGGHDGYPVLFQYTIENQWKQISINNYAVKHSNTINAITIINSHQFTTSSFDGCVLLWNVSETMHI